MTVIFLTTTGANTWPIPADWNNAANTVEVLGAGGASHTNAAGGGGGGAYAKKTNVTLSPGGSANYTVGIGGATSGTAGGDSWFNGTSLGASPVGAKGGGGGGAAAAGAGGLFSGSVGDSGFNGGNGGFGTAGSNGGCGGGGAGGPNGNGAVGGNNNTASANGGGGGGGSGGGSAGANNTLGNVGGNGGNNSSSTGGGTGGASGGNPGVAGTNGGGGGGGGAGANVLGTGGNGGAGIEWTSTAGPTGGAGGGGGGGASNGAFDPQPGNGGLYGAGGGSGTQSGALVGTGAQGIIVITYTPAPTSQVQILQELASSGTGTSVTITPASNLTPGSSIHVVVKASTSTTFACSDATNGSYTALGAVQSDASSHHGQHFVFNGNSSAGKPLITVTCSPSGTSLGIIFREIGNTSGLDTHVENCQFAGGTAPVGTDTATTGNASPTFAPGLVSAAFEVFSGTTTIAAGTGYTIGIHPLTGWGFSDSMSETKRYLVTTPLAATGSLAGSGSSVVMSFAALFKEAVPNLMGAIVC